MFIFQTFKPWPLFYELPTFFSHIILLVRFLVIFITEVKDKCHGKKSSCDVLLGEECDFKIGPHYIDHVKTLLQGVPKNVNNKWYVKGRNFVYTPEPHFKYSVAILSTVIVAAIIIYEFTIVTVGVLVGYLTAIRDILVMYKPYYVIQWGEQTYDLTIQIFDIFIVSFLMSCIVSALFMYFQMYRMLVSHRNHVIKLIKSDRRFLPNTLNTPDVMVGMSLRFCGYQIAYFLWGFIILMFVLLILVVGIASMILFLPMALGPELSKMVVRILIGIVPTVGMAVFIWLTQQILARFVFKDRSFDSKVVNIDNRRCFLLVSFFFFFFNILVGLMSCMLRILKGMVLGILFIGRIDRPLIMKGFTNLDTGNLKYLIPMYAISGLNFRSSFVDGHAQKTGSTFAIANNNDSSVLLSALDVDGIDNNVPTNGW
ncbi:hypothetical protein QZH41_014235, partial [Actinostola sp. cb2023]